MRIDNRVPDLHIDLDAALMLANENSPEIQNMLRRKVESESAVSRAKANAGLKADIYLRFGLTQTADKLKDAYRNPLDQQYVSLGITLQSWTGGAEGDKYAWPVPTETLSTRR